MAKPEPQKPRRNAAQTRARILAAAQQAFARQGYAQTGIREIAAAAGITSPLLLRYFGSKAGLYEAALIDAMRFDRLADLERSGMGERMARWFVDEQLELTPPAMIALATGDAEAAPIASRVAEEHAIRPLAAWLGAPDSRVRALEIFMLATSFVLYTRQLPVLELGQASRRKLAAWLAETIQAVIDRG